MLGTADNRSITNTDSDMPGGVYQLSSCLRVFGWGHPSRVPNTGAAQMGATDSQDLVLFKRFRLMRPATMLISTPMQHLPSLPPLSIWIGKDIMRNWVDWTAANVFQNAKHLAEDKVNGLSIYRSHRSSLGPVEKDERQAPDAADGQVSIIRQRSKVS